MALHFHFIQFLPSPLLFHYLLYAPLTVVTILLLDGPLFYGYDPISMPSSSSFYFFTLSYTFHSIPILLPPVYTFDCCSHFLVGWSAFLATICLSHCLLCIPLNIPLEGPLFCSFASFSFITNLIMYCCYSFVKYTLFLMNAVRWSNVG
jgi:hypothetical protein